MYRQTGPVVSSQIKLSSYWVKSRLLHRVIFEDRDTRFSAYCDDWTYISEQHFAISNLHSHMPSYDPGNAYGTSWLKPLSFTARTCSGRLKLQNKPSPYHQHRLIVALDATDTPLVQQLLQGKGPSKKRTNCMHR